MQAHTLNREYKDYHIVRFRAHFIAKMKRNVVPRVYFLLAMHSEAEQYLNSCQQRTRQLYLQVYLLCFFVLKLEFFHPTSKAPNSMNNATNKNVKLEQLNKLFHCIHTI